MRKFFVLLLCLGLIGCATLDPTYYTNPNSLGYTEQALGGICEICNRTFLFSGQQYDTLENIQCPYDGHVQNLKMASNRYLYWKQQQDQIQQAQQQEVNSVALYNFIQSYQQNAQRSYERQQQYYENMGNAFLNWGGLKSTPSYQYIPVPPTLPSRQGVYWTPSGDGSSWHSSEGEMCIQLLNGGWKCSK